MTWLKNKWTSHTYNNTPRIFSNESARVSDFWFSCDEPSWIFLVFPFPIFCSFCPVLCTMLSCIFAGHNDRRELTLEELVLYSFTWFQYHDKIKVFMTHHLYGFLYSYLVQVTEWKVGAVLIKSTRIRTFDFNNAKRNSNIISQV